MTAPQVNALMTPVESFMVAFVNRDVDKIQEIFNSGVRPSDLDFPNGLTCLHLALTTKNLDFISCILDNGADIEARCDEDLTPLHLAIGLKLSGTIIKYLLDNGADPLALSNETTPFETAKKLCDEEYLQLFINRINLVVPMSC